MDKYDMRNYIEKNFDKIIEDHFKGLQQKLMYPDSTMIKILNNFEALTFYKAWKESPGFKATIFLDEIKSEESKELDG